MVFKFLSSIGDKLNDMRNDVVQAFDGSWIAIQTEKPVYNAGDVINGFVIVQANSPKNVQQINLKISIKEKVYYDVETSRTVYEGEGENRTAKTVYTHNVHTGKHVILNEMIIVSQLNHTVLPGCYQYPFQYRIPDNVPATISFYKEASPSDPAWRSAGKKLVTRCSTQFTLSAFFDVAKARLSDLKCKQSFNLNPRLDASKLAPATASRSAQAKTCGCFSRGLVTLEASFDKGAYTAGEVAQVNANIKNDSEINIDRMEIYLTRIVEMSSNGGHRHSVVDRIAHAQFPGVPSKQSAPRHMPLPLGTNSSGFLPSSSGRLVTVSYRLEVNCDLPCAPDLAVAIVPQIYAAQPTTWGLAALGLSLPPTITLPSSYVMAPVVAPPQQPAYPPPQQPGYPPQQPGYPPQQPGYPPQQQPGYPPQQPGYPPQQQPGYPPQQQPGTPTGYPPQQQLGTPTGYPPQQQPGTPTGYPPQQGGFPPQQQPYAPVPAFVQGQGQFA